MSGLRVDVPRCLGFQVERGGQQAAVSWNSLTLKVIAGLAGITLQQLRGWSLGFSFGLSVEVVRLVRSVAWRVRFDK